MSVDRTDYIVYGWKLPYTTTNRTRLNSDQCLSMIEGHSGEEFILVLDDMCGDYIVFGKRISSDFGKESGWEFIQLDLKNYNSDEVKSKFLEVFGIIPSEEPSLFIFSHFY